MKYFFTIPLICVLAISFAQSSFDHSDFDKLLIKHVSKDGIIAYKNFKKDEKNLDRYLDLLSKNEPKSNWSKNDQLAYWINTYNAFTIKLILKNYPLKSIMDLHNGKPWEIKWIKIGNNTYSLNNIENDIIRKEFKEPRIHFAINCAARSCPTLRNHAFTGKNLDAELETQTKQFINNTKFNQFDKKETRISRIFEWYEKDFGDLKAYIKKYRNFDSRSKLRFLQYDWQLNGE